MPTAARGATLILLGALLAQAPLAGSAAGYVPPEPTGPATPAPTTAPPITAPTTAPPTAPATAPTTAPTTGPATVPSTAPTTGPATVPSDEQPVAVPPVARSWSEVVQQVTATSPDNALPRADAAEQAGQVMRCFKLEDENYCLGLGFVDQLPTGAELRATATAPESVGDQNGDQSGAAAGRLNSKRAGQKAEPQAKAEDGTATGGLTPADFVAERSAMPKSSRVDAELKEMETAWAGREKARALRLLGTDQAVAATPQQQPSLLALPSSAYIMNGYQTSQERGYWCGPATFQSIDWADDKQRDTQTSWSKDLGTTTSGTAITAMVKQTNLKTKWDVAAGTYIVQNVGHWTTQKFFTVHQNHLGDGTPAPIIEHPQLLKRYFPYLAFNHSGHFQVGRGYNAKTGTIGIFEVFNERRFNSRGNVTNGPKNVPASALFNATLANQFKNIGL